MAGIEKFITKVCVQDAVYWPPPEADGYGGVTDTDAEAVKVRWDDKSEIITDRDGKEIISRAQILTPTDMEEQGWLYLGSLTQLQEDLWPEVLKDTSPMEIEGAFEIKRVTKVPMIFSTTVFVRTVYL